MTTNFVAAQKTFSQQQQKRGKNEFPEIGTGRAIEPTDR